MQPIVHILTVGDQVEAKRELKEIGVDPDSFNIMAPKMQHVLVKIKDVDVRAANVIKQEMLAKGAEAAVAKWTSSFSRPTTDIILMATLKQYDLVLKKFQTQPYGLSELIAPIEKALADISGARTKEVVCGSHKLLIGEKTLVMGILNVTPDSFSEQGLFFDTDRAAEHAFLMVDEGADIIDVGGESTRPGAKPVDVEEEARRVIPVIAKLAGELRVPISVDTSKAKVAAAAVDAGAVMVNDISALTGDKSMAAVCAETDVAVILMHMRGEPRTMQENLVYDDLISEIVGYLSERLLVAGRAGVDPEKLLIDPGIGFGKSATQNLEILKRLREFKSLGKPLVLGASRKSTIGKVLGDLPTQERVEGTAATVAGGIMNGADIVRVHDVKEMARVAGTVDAIMKGAVWVG